MDGGGVLVLREFQSAVDLKGIVVLVEENLSEPYSVFTYHSFLHNAPHLCRVAYLDSVLVGVIIGKISYHGMTRRGYIGMLAVDSKCRSKGIGTTLVKELVQVMINEAVEEIVLETEITNAKALNLYSKLGFVRDKRLPKYYLNGSDAFRLKLWLY